MTRYLSHIEAGGRIVEHAGSGQPITMAEREIRERCRTAPEFVRRNIDARRKARGQRPLWGDDARADRVHARAAAAASRHRAFVAASAAR
jgi:hypothetical protein